MLMSRMRYRFPCSTRITERGALGVLGLRPNPLICVVLVLSKNRYTLMLTRVVLGVGGPLIKLLRTGAYLVEGSEQTNEQQHESYSRVIPFGDCDDGIRIIYVVHVPEGIFRII